MLVVTGFGPNWMAPRPPSPWMLAREHRLEAALRWWLVALALSGAVGLVYDGWLWAPVAVAGVRAVVMIVLWARVEGARWWSRRTDSVRVFAAVPRRQVQAGTRGTPAWGDQLVGGVLDASDDQWIWRPYATGGGTGGQLAVKGADAVAVLATSAHDPGMPPAEYVSVVRRRGDEIELLIWDFGVCRRCPSRSGDPLGSAVRPPDQW